MQHRDGKNNACTKLCRGKVHGDILSGQAGENSLKIKLIKVLEIKEILMKLKLGYQELIANAMAQIETVPLGQAQTFLGDENTVFVDIRDVRELERDGMIPNAIHAPRGMLEFWVDPDSPYYNPHGAPP
jgi:hypothetical protein